MRPTRRQVLKALGVAAAGLGVAALGAGLLAERWYLAPPAQGYRFLSTREAAVARALAGAAWPAGPGSALDGADADLDHFLDALVAPWPEPTRALMLLLLGSLDDLCLLDEGSGFLDLTPGRRVEVLTGWLDSDTAELRAAVSSAVVLLGAGWTTHPKVGGVLPSLYRCGYYR